MKVIKLSTPLETSELEKLNIGDKVLLSGKIYTARDAAHKRLINTLNEGKPLPFDVKGQVIYYVGPTPPKPNTPAGSAGPTTSTRMDPYTPVLLDLGLKGIIGKGPRSKPVVDSIIKNKAVYFIAIGGAGVLLAESIKASNLIAYEDLGAEAIREFVVEDFPLIVGIDVLGNDLYIDGVKQYEILEETR
jgi:fumarate hydratase subunit beta